MAIFAGAGVSVVQAGRANDEARRANEAAERARVVKEFVVDVFKVNSRDNPANSELRQLPAELLLERGARLIELKFAEQPQLRAELYGVVGGIFGDMGNAKLASDYATKQIDSLIVMRGNAKELAKARILLARALAKQGRLADSEAAARQAVESASGNGEAETRARLALASTLHRFPQGRPGVRRGRPRAARARSRPHGATPGRGRPKGRSPRRRCAHRAGTVRGIDVNKRCSEVSRGGLRAAFSRTFFLRSAASRSLTSHGSRITILRKLEHREAMVLLRRVRMSLSNSTSSRSTPTSSRRHRFRPGTSRASCNPKSTTSRRPPTSPTSPC